MKKYLLSIYLIFSFFFSNAQPFGPGSGNCLVFSEALSTRVNIPDAPVFDHPGNNISLEAWIFPTAYTTLGGLIFSKHETIGTREYDILVMPDGRFRFAIYDNASTPYLIFSVNTIPLNTWTHVVGTYSFASGIISVYVNGINEASNNIGQINLASTPSRPLIGAYWLSNNNLSRAYFTGIIDEVRLWHSTRTQTEIRDNMCRTLATPQANLIAYYRFDEAGGLSANDASGNGNNGILQSFAVAQTNDWNFSGAPIGNESVNQYPAGVGLTLASIPSGVDEGTMTIDNITGSPSGIHLYRVDALPVRQMDWLSHSVLTLGLL